MTDFSVIFDEMDCRMGGYWQNRPVYNKTKELCWAPVHARTNWVYDHGRRAVFARINDRSNA